jgi:hypothetical protein
LPQDARGPIRTKSIEAQIGACARNHLRACQSYSRLYATCIRHQTSVGIPNLLHLSSSKPQADAAALRAPLTLCACKREAQAKQYPYWSNSMKAETRGMTNPDEIRATRKEEGGKPCRQGMMVAKETLCVVTRHATREEMLCSLENYIRRNSRPGR